MAVHLTDPDLQSKLEQWATQTGRSAGDLVEARRILDSRYDEIKSCKVNLIPGDEVEAELRQRIAGRRSPRT